MRSERNTATVLLKTQAVSLSVTGGCEFQPQPPAAEAKKWLTGAAVSVTANGAVTLQGFADSAVSSLNIRVNAYAELKEMIRSGYGGRVVDVLMIETA